MAKQINRGVAGEPTQKKASTAYKVGDCITIDSNGFAVPGGAGKVKGICLEQITSADADYTSTRDLVFAGYNHEDIFEFPVITGSATQTLVGELVDIDATDARGVDVTATTNDQVEVVRVINATTIWGKFVPQTTG